jgi:hypothetical protein
MALLAAVLVPGLLVALVLVWVAADQASFANVGEPAVLGLGFATVGFTVVRRQPGNAVGWLLLAFAILILAECFTSGYALLCFRLGHGGLPLGRPAVVIEAVSGTFGVVSVPLAVMLFPDGTLPSRRWRLALLAFTGLAALVVVSELAEAVGAVVGHAVQVDSGGGLVALDHAPRVAWEAAVHDLGVGVYPVVWLTSAARQVAAWRRADGIRRQQLKWLMSGACLAGFGLAGIIIADSTPGAATSGAVNAVDTVLSVLLLALPLSIGVAILKYRLYEIDRIVSRTLAYAIVTGLLIGLYTGLVLLATRVLSFHTPVAVAVSTLAAAALFNPLRRRVQLRVDRRFNRTRYNADQTVAAFAARLKDTVDMDSLRDDLAGVVYQALEPDHVSLWIGEP